MPIAYCRENPRVRHQSSKCGNPLSFHDGQGESVAIGQATASENDLFRALGARSYSFRSTCSTSSTRYPRKRVPIFLNFSTESVAKNFSRG